MNKGLRQFLVFFIFVCAVMLTVLTVQVFLLGGKVEADAELPDMLGSESPPPEETSPLPVETDNVSPPEVEPPEETPEEPDSTAIDVPLSEGMKRVELPLPGKGTLLIDYYIDVFEHAEQDFGDYFMYLSPEGDDASMTVLFKQNQTAAAAAPRFFDDARPDETTADGPQSLGRTGLTGEHVKAMLGEEVFEAWLVDIDDGIIAFSLKYSDEKQMDALYGLIETMWLTQ